jgi:hypothetical protein
MTSRSSSPRTTRTRRRTRRSTTIERKLRVGNPKGRCVRNAPVLGLLLEERPNLRLCSVG